MYQSTDNLVSNEQGVARSGYQSVEGGSPVGGNESNVSEVPQTFMAKVKKAREENIGCCNFCMAFFALILGSIVWTLVVIVVITVPIIMIVVGAEYFHECPIQKMIPIALIVGGCVGLLSNVLNFVDRLRRFSETGFPRRQTVIGWINLLINLFLAAWFVAACYWVYSVNPDFKRDPTRPTNFCNHHLYGFIYWLLNFIFIFFGVMVLASALVMCFALMCW